MGDVATSVMAIDPSSRHIGWALFDVGADAPLYLSSGTEKVPEAPPDERVVLQGLGVDPAEVAGVGRRTSPETPREIPDSLRTTRRLKDLASGQTARCARRDARPGRVRCNRRSVGSPARAGMIGSQRLISRYAKTASRAGASAIPTQPSANC